MRRDMRDRVIDAAIAAFAHKGMKFTMDDIAREAGMSKKTIYHQFDSKEALCFAVTDRCFADIKQSEQAIFDDDTLSTLEKLRRIMVVLPDHYQNIGLNKLCCLKDKFPAVYDHLSQQLETNWDLTITLLEQGMAEGVVRPISVPLLKTMLESTLQRFFCSDVLLKNDLSYEQALQEIIDIFIQGIRA